jgi:hypothetical protein
MPSTITTVEHIAPYSTELIVLPPSTCPLVSESKALKFLKYFYPIVLFWLLQIGFIYYSMKVTKPISKRVIPAKADAAENSDADQNTTPVLRVRRSSRILKNTVEEIICNLLDQKSHTAKELHLKLLPTIPNITKSEVNSYLYKLWGRSVVSFVQLPRKCPVWSRMSR